MKSLQPELFMTLRPDAIDEAIELTLDSGPRCVHCGFEKVKHHGHLCIKCVKKLALGLVLLGRRSK